LRLCRGTPLLNTLYRLFGARIGRGVFLDTTRIWAFDLVTIHSNCSVLTDASLAPYHLDEHSFAVGGVHLGAGSIVGARSVLSSGCVLEAGAELAACSAPRPGSSLEANSYYAGSPAVQGTAPPTPRELQPSSFLLGDGEDAQLWTCEGHSLFFVTTLAMLCALTAALIPSVYLFKVILNIILAKQSNFVVVLLLPMGIAFFAFTLAVEAIIVRLFLVRYPGQIRPLNSSWYARKWLLVQLIYLCGRIDWIFHDTPLYRLWLCCLGAQIGPSVQLGDALCNGSTLPELVHVEAGVCIGPGVLLAPAEVKNGMISLRSITLGNGAVVGRGSVVLCGTSLGPQESISILSCLVVNDSTPRREGSTNSRSIWSGLPAVEMEKAQVGRHGFEAYSAINEEDYERQPSPATSFDGVLFTLVQWLVAIYLPSSPFLLTAFWERAKHDQYSADLSIYYVVPLAYLLVMAANALLAVLWKYLIICKLRPGMRPEGGAWRHRKHLADFFVAWHGEKGVVSTMVGTPYVTWWVWALGASVGHGVCLNSLDMPEPDLIALGDGVCVGSHCALTGYPDNTGSSAGVILCQVVMHSGASVQSGSLVIGGGNVEPNANVSALSLIQEHFQAMRSRFGVAESLHVLWQGNPLQPSQAFVPEFDNLLPFPEGQSSYLELQSPTMSWYEKPLQPISPTTMYGGNVSGYGSNGSGYGSNGSGYGYNGSGSYQRLSSMDDVTEL